MRQPDKVRELKKQMEIAQLFRDHIVVQQTATGEQVSTAFSLYGVIKDPVERAMLLKFYRAGFEEVVPTFVERLSEPLVMADTTEQLNYTHHLQKTIDAALRHIQAVFEGTHRWSSLLSVEEVHEQNMLRLLHFSGCRIFLITRCDPKTQEKTFTFFFYAGLYGRESTEANAVTRQLDTDPRPSEV